MQRFALRLAILIAALLVASQFVIPPLVARHVEKELTAQGGDADVHLSAFPAIRLLFGHGHKLTIDAERLSVDLGARDENVFDQLDHFDAVDIRIRDSHAGPFSVDEFRVKRTAARRYAVGVVGNGVAGGPIPFDATMEIDSSTRPPKAHHVTGDVIGFPAGPLGEIVANALLSAL
jgi:hypothetical protein